MSGYPTFSVRNLGPIAEGTVELRPLTILVGKNNTGKTYMAQAIYAAYKALERANGPVEPLLDEGESEELISRLHSSLRRNGELLQGSLKAKAEKWMRARLDRAGGGLERRLSVYFDVDDLQDLKRWGSREPLTVSAEVVSRPSDPTVLFSLGSANKSGARLPSVPVSSLRSTGLSDYFEDLLVGAVFDEYERGETTARRKRASSRLADHLWRHHLLPSVGLTGVAHYLPAGRSGLLEAWTDVVRLRLELDREGLALEGREPAALGGIALDFLLELQELIRPSRRRQPRRLFKMDRNASASATRPRDVETATDHLQHLINGRVDIVHGRERVPALTYRHGGESIPVQRASSMVAELAPLISWIELILEPGDLLLIDEPEAHMHPEAILAVAQTLVALSRSGVRVLCTTHSSEFLHQVSNCMLRTTASSGGPSSLQPAIDSDEIGVFRFVRESDASGTVIIPVEVDPAWGIPEDEHVAVAERLANETAELVDGSS